MRNWIWFALSVFLFSSAAVAKTQLNGLAGYERLGKEYYLAALYLPEVSNNPLSIIADNRAQRMIIKVTASRWSVRKFTSFWREGFALNNNLAADVELTNHISNFIRLPEENLTTGDTIDIQFAPVTGTVIRLNEAVIYQTEGKALFNALLKTWLGEVPHSRLFQSQMLGNEVNMGSTLTSRVTRFNTLDIAAGRKNLVANWAQNSEAEQLAIAEAEAALKREQEEAEAAKKAAAAAKKKREQERLAAQKAAEKAKREAELAKAKNNSSDLEKIEAAIAAQKVAELRAAEIERALQAEKAIEVTQQQMNDYVLAQYEWEVLRDVYKRVSYPEWARQFNQQGTVNVEFIIGNDGQLLGIAQVTPENSGLLGQELKDAVKRAAPFEAFPSQLTQNQLKVRISYKFTLAERVAEVPPPPVAPEGLDLNAGLSNVQRAVAWSKYKDEISEQINSSIEYPFWAQDLKQEGTVVAEVLVLADGSISKVVLKEKSRHAILNQEVEQAIDRLGAVAAFPSWVKDQTLTVLIEHKFEL